MTYTDHEQRMLDQQSGAEMDKRGIGSGRIGPTMASIRFEEYLTLVSDRERARIQRDDMVGLLSEARDFIKHMRTGAGYTNDELEARINSALALAKAYP